ncbi:MAG: DUF2953 domain-containing protein [Clostridia bacterium]|nr:DUF2953 domain-containing protein [Clostridia bacterium]
MKALIIIAFILTLILTLRVGARIQVNTASGEPIVKLIIGFLRIPILPAKEKRLKLSDYTIEKLRKAEAREAAKKAAAEEKKAAKKHDKQVKSTKAQTIPPEEKPERDILGLIGKITRVAKVAIARFGHHLRFDLGKLVIIVASPDAATTAVQYGAIVGAVQCLLTALYEHDRVKTTNKTEIRVEPDFTSEKLTADIDISFSFRIWNFFDLGIRALTAFLKSNE